MKKRHNESKHAMMRPISMEQLVRVCGGRESTGGLATGPSYPDYYFPMGNTCDGNGWGCDLASNNTGYAPQHSTGR